MVASDGGRELPVDPSESSKQQQNKNLLTQYTVLNGKEKRLFAACYSRTGVLFQVRGHQLFKI